MLKKIALLATAAFCLGNAHADEIVPRQLAMVYLGAYTAVVYYTERGNEYEVVTTIGPNHGTDGSIVRHVTRVRAGQRFDIEFGSYGAGSTLNTIAVSVTDSGEALSVAGSLPYVAGYD